MCHSIVAFSMVAKSMAESVQRLHMSKSLPPFCFVEKRCRYGREY